MEQPPPMPEAQIETPQPPATSLAGRMLNVFADPGEVFAEVKQSAPSVANWLAPALVLILVSWIGGWLVFSQPSIQQQISDMTEQAVQKGLQKQIDSGKMSKEQAENVKEMAVKWGGISSKIGAAVVPVGAAFFAPFWGGLILWLVGAKVLKGGFSFMKAVEVAGLANTISILDAVVRTLLILKVGNIAASPSLMLLVKDFNPQNPVHGLYALVNVTVFWLLIVKSIGLAKLSGASFAKSAVWLFGIWFLLTALQVGFSFGAYALSNR